MKRIILVTICLVAFGLICCTSNSGNVVRNEYIGLGRTIYVSTLKDSKDRPHKIAVFSHSKGLAAIDLDVNTYK